MKRLKLFILIFCLTLALPLAYFVARTFDGLAQEEVAELDFFGESLFDRMEEELRGLVEQEEARAVDEYNATLPTLTGAELPSPLSSPPPENYIIGYLQNGPDGSFQTPYQKMGTTPSDLLEKTTLLARINTTFNRIKTLQPPAQPLASKPEKVADIKTRQSLSDKYLAASPVAKMKEGLGQAGKRYEKITMDQAQNIARLDQIQSYGATAGRLEAEMDQDLQQNEFSGGLKKESAAAPAVVSTLRRSAEEKQAAKSLESSPLSFKDGVTQNRPQPPTYQVEVAPLQSMVIDKNHVFVYRRIVLNNQIFRQGLVIKIREFLQHLSDNHFANQPMARFTGLELAATGGAATTGLTAGIPITNPKFQLTRVFPRPFAFLSATISCEKIPPSAGRRTLSIMVFILTAVILTGLAAIYQSARVVVDHSERKSGFVSSVTHELKTPLTNIRMYIEMLEQGIARDKEREQEYFRILSSESSRLSRLINNVLEFSKLERQNRQVNMQDGDFIEVVDEVSDIMREKLRQEGFLFTVDNKLCRPFRYDREIMVQVLVNLIENSIKFSPKSSIRSITLTLNQDSKSTLIAVSDTGPGIPDSALSKIFDDFYRVDNTLTHATQGTGIGLALVKKLVTAMGGTVSAVNNKEAGCAITMSLPS